MGGFLLSGGVLVGLLVAAAAEASPCDPSATIRLSAGQTRVALGTRAFVLEDPERRLTLDDVFGLPGGRGFEAGSAPLGPDLASRSRF